MGKWCTYAVLNAKKKYNQKKVNRKPHLPKMLVFTNNGYNGLYRFSL